MNFLKIKILFLFIFIFPFKSIAGTYELDFDFGYDRQIYGANRENSVVSRNYSGGVSVYLFDLTALDLNVSYNNDIDSQNDRVTVGPGWDLVAQQNRIKTNVYSIGVKQMLAGRGSRLVPVISAGYAREFVTSSSDWTVQNTVTGAQEVIFKNSKQRYNSAFGAFTLQLKLTERFSLKGSVKTIIPDFEFSKARDNLKYLVGFAWIF